MLVVGATAGRGPSVRIRRGRRVSAVVSLDATVVVESDDGRGMLLVGVHRGSMGDGAAGFTVVG